MCKRMKQSLILVALGLGFISPEVAGQELSTRPPASAIPLPISGASPAAAPERRGSAIETLESLTGARPEGGDEIETDRDSFTPATVIAPRGRFILELAYTFEDNRGFKETHSFPETILRYGLTDRIELRLGWNAEMGGGGSELTGSDSGGEGDIAGGRRAEREYTLAYGAKFRVTDQNRWMPRSIVIVQAFTPTGGSAGTSTATAPHRHLRGRMDVPEPLAVRRRDALRAG